jgi:uncharacterized damage-inducible protein DinB
VPQEIARVETARLADQIRRAARGHAWSGPSAREALDGVTAPMAAAHPVVGAHSIWELVRHMTVWATVVRRRVSGEIVEPTAAQDWPALTGHERPADWEADLQALFAAHEALAASVEQLDDAALDRALSPVYTTYVTLHGQAQHTLYHTGQISLLKRALGRPT